MHKSVNRIPMLLIYSNRISLLSVLLWLLLFIIMYLIIETQNWFCIEYLNEKYWYNIFSLCSFSEEKFWIDFSSFDKILVHLKLQTCFVRPGLISAIWSFQKTPLKLNEFDDSILLNKLNNQLCLMVRSFHFMPVDSKQNNFRVLFERVN